MKINEPLIHQDVEGTPFKVARSKAKKKEAVSLVRLYPGEGNITINHEKFETYYAEQAPEILDFILKPIHASGLNLSFNLDVLTRGGGVSSQIKSIQIAISKALISFNEECKFIIKRKGFLRQDGRIKERRKYGLKKARKAPQYSKR